jgi:hypothetical protein
MAKIRFAEALEVLPVLAPATATNDTAKTSSFVDLSLCHWVTFIAQFGVITATDTGLMTVAVEGSTTGADSDTEANVTFHYRIANLITAAPGMSAVVSSTSASIASTDVASSLLVVEVDPSENPDYRYVRLSIDPAADTTAWTVGIVAFKEPRYPGAAIPSLFTST